MEAYHIETIKAEGIMMFIFWGNAILLTEASSGRSFSKYYINSSSNPTAPSGWSFSSHAFAVPIKTNLQNGDTIDRVTDEFGNIYYEVTL